MKFKELLVGQRFRFGYDYFTASHSQIYEKISPRRYHRPGFFGNHTVSRINEEVITLDEYIAQREIELRRRKEQTDDDIIKLKSIYI